MNLLRLGACGKCSSFLRSFATDNPRRFVPAKPYESKINREQLPPKTKLDRETIEILEKLSLVGTITKENAKIVEDAIAFADQILQVDTSEVEPLYTVLEDWPLHVREDTVEREVCLYDLMKNAKRVEEDYFVAPTVNVPVNTGRNKDENK